MELAEKLTTDPGSVSGEDMCAGRGSTTRAIQRRPAHFNYINRIAEGLGVDPEPWLGDDGRPHQV